MSREKVKFHEVASTVVANVP